MLEFEWAYYYDTLKLNIKTDGDYTPLRTVKEYEIELYTEDGGISVLNGEKFAIKKGNVLIAIPGDKRQSRLHFKCHSVKFLCGEDIEFAKMIQKISGVHYTEGYEELESCFNDIYKTTEEIESEIFLDVKIRSLAVKLYKKLKYSRLPLSQHRLSLNKAVRFINENADKKICLADIANAASISVSYFHRIFKEVYNMSPGDYLMMKRIEMSKNLLLNNLLTVDEVAEKSGFFSRAYFDTVFKKQTGITPVQFRKKYNTYI